MQMTISTISTTRPPLPKGVMTPPQVTSTHLEGQWSIFTNADRHYGHTLEDLILCNVHSYDDDNVSATSFSSARGGPSMYEDTIDLLAAESMSM
jgi:hypothetical protein